MRWADARQADALHPSYPSSKLSIRLLKNCILVQQYCTVRRNVRLRSGNAISASCGARLLQSAAFIILCCDQRNAEREVAEAEI